MPKYRLIKDKLTGSRAIIINKTSEVVTEHHQPERYVKLRKLVINNFIKAQKDQVMRDCGLVKVKGSLGGVYWE